MNFKSAIEKLILQRTANDTIHTIKVNKGWEVIFCPLTEHYYAMDLEEACIGSGISFIRPAYRIDPTTGEYDASSMEKNGKPRKFAIKIFDGNKQSNFLMAENEAAALNENQVVEGSVTNDGQPIIVMTYHAGSMVCELDGKPSEILSKLSLRDRLALILQITNQFYEMHAQKTHKKPRIHIDIKGANIIIDVPEGGPVNARVIDFGSSKILDETGQVATALRGLSLIAVPPEATKEAKKQNVLLDDVIGVLDSKSDIYSLGSVYAAMLGASDPYVNRRGDIRQNVYYDMMALNGQIAENFDLTGLLDLIAPLPFAMFSDRQPCAFRNLSDKEAPKDKTILEEASVPAVGYVLYKDQLLYVNKAKQRVSGRDITSKLGAFNRKVAKIRSLPDVPDLAQMNLAHCLEINSAHPQERAPIDLKPFITSFIERMVANNPTERPTMEEVLQFFTVANKIASLATVKDPSRTREETERCINIALLKLHIIAFKGWHLELPLLYPNNTKRAGGSFAQFDFDLLEEDNELYDQFAGVFRDLDILEGKKPLTSDTFRFLQIKSDEKKLYDAILTKLEIPVESKPVPELDEKRTGERTADTKNESLSHLDEKVGLRAPQARSSAPVDDLLFSANNLELKQGEQGHLGATVLRLLSTPSKEPALVKKQGIREGKHLAIKSSAPPELPVGDKKQEKHLATKSSALPALPVGDKKQGNNPEEKQLDLKSSGSSGLPVGDKKQEKHLATKSSALPALPVGDKKQGNNPEEKQLDLKSSRSSGLPVGDKKQEKHLATKSSALPVLPSAPKGLPVGNKLLNLSKPMMLCLLEEKIPLSFANDFNLKKEFVERRDFIRADFPLQYQEMKKVLTSQGVESMRVLLQNAPNIVLFLSHDLNDDAKIAELLKLQYQVEPNQPLTSESEAKLLALYQVMLRHKKYIQDVTSQATVDKLNEILTKPLLHKLQKYVDDLENLKKQNVTYKQWSIFGLFGYKVADKHEAASALLKEFKAGNHQVFLEKVQKDSKLKSMLTGKTLGRLAQSHLSCMKMTPKFRV